MPGDIVWWPAESDWAWKVDHVIIHASGRLLALSRGDREDGIATRVVNERDVSSNAFLLTD